ncbi:hypothetical protein [Desulfonatronum thiodismutans]|uniref:hypothetical protein n=1 Tax=Desulfonatronum thiodismutans TaxID=159290 RepID=UPI0004ABDC36|nr:hypothetical protein [Desulfonatronum thiodismutans]
MDQPCTLDDYYAKISEIDGQIEAKLQRKEELEQELAQAKDALGQAENRKQEAITQVARNGNNKATTTALDKAIAEVDQARKHVEDTERMVTVIRADINELRSEVFRVERQSRGRYRDVLTVVRDRSLERVREVEDAAWLAWQAERELGRTQSFANFAAKLFPTAAGYDWDAQAYATSSGTMSFPKIPDGFPQIPEAPKSKHLDSCDRREMEIAHADS